jgi:hypothetical protein
VVHGDPSRFFLRPSLRRNAIHGKTVVAGNAGSLGRKCQQSEVVHWPPGSVTINEVHAVQRIINSDANVIKVEPLGPTQVRFSPKSDGKTLQTYTLTGGTFQTAELRLEVVNGRIDMDWSLEHK